MGRRVAKRIGRWLARRPRRAVALLLFAVFTAWFAQALPDTLFDDPSAIVLEDASGTLLAARIARDGQWRFPPSNEVPHRFAAAIIAFEDTRFHFHPGVDPLAVLRALKENISAGKVVSGASTLSMQVVRLSRNNPPRTLFEKIHESLLALRLELAYEKQEILALYASHAPFGGNVVGLEAAAWRYFGRSPQTLSWAEVATLAVLPNSPGLIHPGRGRQALEAKRDRLLHRLAEQGELGARELKLALAEPLADSPRDLPQLAQHLLDTLVREQPHVSRFTVTLDSTLQRRASQLVARHGELLKRQGINNVAALIIDNHTGSAVAYVGNDSYANPYGGSIDLVQSSRSTGSLLKPVLYAAMLESGELLPQTLIPDVPSDFSGFRPENYDRQYRGAVRADQALSQSLNVPAVFMLRQHGVARFQHELKQLGMTTLFRTSDEYGLSLVLGGAEGSLFELTGLYARLARPELPRNWRPALLESSSSKKTGRTVFGAGSAWLTLEALLEVNRPGNEVHWKTFSSSRRIAWKTGTSFGLRDAWAIGMTPNYTIGVWAGNASGEGRAGLTGTESAAPLLFDLFAGLDIGGWFDKPVFDLKAINVCRNDGLLPANDCEIETVEAPRRAHFARVSSNHRRVHVNRESGQRVSAGCVRVADMEARSWFVLPPLQEAFYRQAHADYVPLPAWENGCSPRLAQVPFEIVYPMAGSRIYIPDDFGAARSRVIFTATHRDPEARLYWHIDGHFMGVTDVFHEMALDLAAGRHELVLVDEVGHRVSRYFEIVSKNQESQARPVS